MNVYSTVLDIEKASDGRNILYNITSYLIKDSKKRSPRWLRSIGVQFPSENTIFDFDTIISKPTKDSNGKKHAEVAKNDSLDVKWNKCGRNFVTMKDKKANKNADKYYNEEKCGEEYGGNFTSNEYLDKITKVRINELIADLKALGYEGITYRN